MCCIHLRCLSLRCLSGRRRAWFTGWPQELGSESLWPAPSQPRTGSPLLLTVPQTSGWLNIPERAETLCSQSCSVGCAWCTGCLSQQDTSSAVFSSAVFLNWVKHSLSCLSVSPFTPSPGPLCKTGIKKPLP